MKKISVFDLTCKNLSTYIWQEIILGSVFLENQAEDWF